MCLHVDHKLPRPESRIKVFKNLTKSINGQVKTPYYRRVVPEDGLLVSDRLSAKRTQVELNTNQIEYGIHVFLTEEGAAEARKDWPEDFTVVGTAEPEDWVASGLDDRGRPSAVFMKVQLHLPQTEEV